MGTLDIRNTKRVYDLTTAEELRELTISTAIYGENFKLCCNVYSGAASPSYLCFAPDDPISSCDYLTGDIQRTYLLVVLVHVTVCVIGFTGNLIVIAWHRLGSLSLRFYI